MTLDAGEAEATALAAASATDVLLLDERRGRMAARERNLKVAGVLGELLHAKFSGHLPSVREEMRKLRSEARFFIRADIESFILSQAGEWLAVLGHAQRAAHHGRGLRRWQHRGAKPGAGLRRERIRPRAFSGVRGGLNLSPEIGTTDCTDDTDFKTLGTRVQLTQRVSVQGTDHHPELSESV